MRGLLSGKGCKRQTNESVMSNNVFATRASGVTVLGNKIGALVGHSLFLTVVRSAAEGAGGGTKAEVRADRGAAMVHGAGVMVLDVCLLLVGTVWLTKVSKTGDSAHMIRSVRTHRGIACEHNTLPTMVSQTHHRPGRQIIMHRPYDNGLVCTTQAVTRCPHWLHAQCDTHASCAPQTPSYGRMARHGAGRGTGHGDAEATLAFWPRGRVRGPGSRQPCAPRGRLALRGGATCRPLWTNA